MREKTNSVEDVENALEAVSLNDKKHEADVKTEKTGEQKPKEKAKKGKNLENRN